MIGLTTKAGIVTKNCNQHSVNLSVNTGFCS